MINDHTSNNNNINNNNNADDDDDVVSFCISRFLLSCSISTLWCWMYQYGHKPTNPRFPR